MSRARRLLDLIQLLRAHRYPVAGQSLATALGVSLRTVYRDIATLQAQGASIEGEPGFGYSLRPGFMLPAMMFTEDEVEALALGSRWVARGHDRGLSRAANSALSKIASALPDDLRASLDANALLVGGSASAADALIDLADMRRAIRLQHKIRIAYRDARGEPSDRLVWPVALGYFDRVCMLAAWCELRVEFRHFRVDRILSLSIESTPIPRARRTLLEAWRTADRRRRGHKAGSPT
ncbi:MAG: YafY family protein [Burkholderiaceae bacterium]